MVGGLVLQYMFGKDGETQPPRTPGGYCLDEVLSALQKDIRRGNEYQAVYWATELESFNEETGAGATMLWNRLKVVASEDVGLANPMGPLIIDVLEKEYYDTRGKNDSWRLFLVHAVLYLARSPKSRVVDNLLNVVYNDERKLEIPDYALDMHTYGGRKMGRGIEHFFAEGAMLAKQAMKDPYEKIAEEIMLDKEKT
jgi:replication-associated recombination protein RarA